MVFCVWMTLIQTIRLMLLMTFEKQNKKRFSTWRFVFFTQPVAKLSIATGHAIQIYNHLEQLGQFA